mmetsp:Transcript_28761/g.44694  ORF Transcript_28761/g.44694 Transcript_28761/m.44694 type:complete len:299 (-) Transcript_28761:157-1053(-)|eukprot:CAMPEP_0196801806 /NCGR_PEP_ID=MMETSP1362-20130617/1593_1 /TAXON_ID=163516 /ORGANISM="Leptocylindrus danicus, Strain CCMP1856" /LENGTH=298 /DNA_ID=CAMNT_0042172949 /DNA_START=153 /DNA_END=1049 /DNA_ORIENTATION=+
MSIQEITPLMKKNEDDGLNLRLRCTGTTRDPLKNEYEIQIPKSGTVTFLKELVRKTIGRSAHGRYLRLISGGKLLAPDDANIESFDLKDGDCVHAVLAAAGVRGGVQAAMSRGVATSDSDSSESESDADDLEAGALRRGFDRLRSSGLSRAEISAVRLYFAPSVDEFISTNNFRHDDEQSEDPSQFRLRMEEDWMATQGPTSEFRMNLNANGTALFNPFRGGGSTFDVSFPVTTRGSDPDFMFGFLMGFFVGMICMVWIWMPTVSYKQKLGILSGIILKLIMNIIVANEDSSLVSEQI